MIKLKICVASSSSVTESIYIELAKDYMQSIMHLDVELICGGVSSSMMKEVYEAFINNDKQVTCYTLSCYNEDNICQNTILLNTTFDRTKKLYEESDLICILPGGSGSLAEVFSFIEESRTQNKKPVILVNENHFFDLILQHMHKLIEEGFNKGGILDYITIIKSKAEFKQKVEEYYGKINNGKIS